MIHIIEMTIGRRLVPKAMTIGRRLVPFVNSQVASMLHQGDRSKTRANHLGLKPKIRVEDGQNAFPKIVSFK
jgi:hypothetical protein